MDYMTGCGKGMTMKQNKERRVLFVVLPLIALLCLSLWYLRNYSRVDG